MENRKGRIDLEGRERMGEEQRGKRECVVHFMKDAHIS